MAPQYKMILITRTGFKGVSQHKGKFAAQLFESGKVRHLGFSTHGARLDQLRGEALLILQAVLETCDATVLTRCSVRHIEKQLQRSSP